MVPVTHYLFVSGALFFIGLTGVLARRSLVVKLFSLEIILDAASINFMAFARLYGDAAGQVYSMLVVVMLALELLAALVIIAAVCSRWKCATPDDGKYLSSQLDY
jgi:NADH-quinone oxidoreductase subunit K